MTTKKFDDGGPAFPYYEQEDVATFEGMTLWDYYAAKALSGLCVPITNDVCWKPTDTAAIAGDMADAMIAERKKRFG